MIPLVTSAIGLTVAALIILLIRTDRLHVTHGIGWLVAAFVMAGLGFAPGIFDSIAIRLGVTYAPALAFTLGFSLIVIKLLIDDIERSRLKMRHTRMIQRMAILENELRRAKKAAADNFVGDGSNNA
jgi:hypothetical protein